MAPVSSFLQSVSSSGLPDTCVLVLFKPPPDPPSFVPKDENTYGLQIFTFSFKYSAPLRKREGGCVRLLNIAVDLCDNKAPIAIYVFTDGLLQTEDRMWETLRERGPDVGQVLTVDKFHHLLHAFLPDGEDCDKEFICGSSGERSL